MSTAIGSVLLQPHKVSAPPVPAAAALLEDALALGIRIILDRTHNGPCLSFIETALGKILQNLRDGMKANEASAVQKFQAWAKPLQDKLTALGQTMPGDSVAHETIASGDILVGLLVDLLGGLTTDELSKHLDTALSILREDLGLTTAFIDQQITKIFDEIVKQLRGAPLESDLTLRENRFEIIALMQRIRREIEGQFSLPEINADRLAGPFLNYLRSINYDNIVSRAANVGKAVKAGLDVMEVISDEVTFSMGFSGGPGAAGSGSSDTKRCWYASWVTGNETRDADPANCAALQQYSFKHVPAATMEKITLHMTWPFTLVDGILVAVLGYLQGRGVYSITTVSMIRDAVYTLIAPLADINLPTVINFPLAQKAGQTFGNLTAWFDKIFNVVAALLCSLEGRSLNSYDFFLYALRFIFRFGASSLPVDKLRDLILSIITLVNHDPSVSTALNRNNDGLIQFLMQIVGPLIHAAVIPDNYFSINGEYGTLIAATLVGGLGMSIVTFFCGMFLSLAFAQSWPDVGVSAGHWAKGWGLSILSFLGFWFILEDGSTNGGKRGYIPGGGRGTEVAFDGYPPAATSPYLMPYAGSAECIQGNHGFWSHNSVINQIFSFDFSLNLGQEILCMRDGEVVSTLDSVDDGDHPDDGNHIVIRHTTPNKDHDKDVGGKATTTYAKYYHGQKGTIAAAFGGALPAAKTIVKQGQLLFKCNSTGMSRCNHIHVQVNGDDGGGNPSGYTIPWVFKDISGDGVAYSKHVYDSQNVKK